MADPREKQFQEDVIAGLEAQGWVRGDPSGYDAARALFPEDVVGFYSSAFPEAWEKFRSWFSVDPESSLLDEVAKNLEKYGTLKVLRDGFKTVGAEVRLAQFLPEHGLNPRLLEAYGRNVLRVVPEVAYSAHGGSGRLDLVLFVNGVPTATLELKSEFTQSVARAVRQYRQDRPPVDPGSRKAEPLLSFKRGALVHFAVSQSNVMMTTHLAGNDTTFLPFDRGGEDGSAGNPPIPGGYDTAYLWEWVLARDAWLQIVGRFVHLQQTREVDARGREQVRESLIFPRYHQWDAVTKLVGAARREGPGGRYLVQHSAGSGKSNSIAWATHQLARLHDREDRKVFRSVIVVTDRTVLDEQLQATIAQFEHQSGVIDAIDRKGSEASKSQRLAKALSGGTPIIVVTLQTFPHVLQLVQEDTSLRGRRSR